MPVKRIKHIANDAPWPKHWEVSFTWDLPKGVSVTRGTPRTVTTREYEIALKGAPSTWYLFERYVYNPANEKEWVDAFTQGGYAAFTAFRPDQIIKVRKRVRPKSKKSITDIEVANNAV